MARVGVALVAALPLLIAARGDAADGPAEYSRKGADSCLACHDDGVAMMVFETPHGQPRESHGPFGPGQLQCEACHGPGGQHAARLRRGEERPPVFAFGPDSETPVETRNAVCVGCHQEAEHVGWIAGAHGLADVACTDCHSVHTQWDRMRDLATQIETCVGCHPDKRTDLRKPFAHPLYEEKLGCGDCHTPHAGVSSHQLATATGNDTCYGCHAEKRGPFLWEHAPVAEDCGDCHTVHGSNHPALLVRRAPLLCQGCHSRRGHPAIAHDASGLPDAGASQYLLGQSCMNCHSQVHGSNHPSGAKLLQ